MDLKQIREKEIALRKAGKKTNINTPEMQDMRWQGYGKGRKQLMPAMIEMYDYICDKVTGGKFLDVGAGEGNLIFGLASKCDLLVGVDISKIRMDWNEEKAKQLGYTNVSFLFSYAEHLNLKDNQFDYSACTATIEHVTDPQKAISEIMRVLKPKGRAFFGIPIEPDEAQPVKSPDHYHFWKSEEEILKMFKGLNVISTKFIKPLLIVEIEKG